MTRFPLHCHRKKIGCVASKRSHVPLMPSKIHPLDPRGIVATAVPGTVCRKSGIWAALADETRVAAAPMVPAGSVPLVLNRVHPAPAVTGKVNVLPTPGRYVAPAGRM